MKNNKFDIALKTTIDFILDKDSFTISELQDKILENGGIFRVSTQQTLYDYLSSYEEKGFLKYFPREKKYINLKKSNLI